MDADKSPFILLLRCADQPGIVARVSDFIFKRGANIITAEQYSTDAHNGDFFMRVEFIPSGEGWDKDSLTADFSPVAQVFKAEYRFYDKLAPLNMGIFVSRPDHCLFELLYLWRSRELRVNIPFVASNCRAHRELVESYGIPFYFVAASKDNRMEKELLEIAGGNSDFLVLARYMIVLSGKFLKDYGKDIINIHHGFLPSFKGADPYRQAFNGGVKVIGATAHFVSEKLDEGPIIRQAVEYVSHKDGVDDLIRKGKNLEKHALATAVASYINHQVIKYNNKTIVFGD